MSRLQYTRATEYSFVPIACTRPFEPFQQAACGKPPSAAQPVETEQSHGGPVRQAALSMAAAGKISRQPAA